MNPEVAFLNGILLPKLSPPFTRDPLDNSTDIVTADNSLYTTMGVGTFKNMWVLRWDYLKANAYNQIYDLYRTQDTLYEYPLFTYPYLNIENVPVRMILNPMEIVNYCGDVENITVQLREAEAISQAGSS